MTSASWRWTCSGTAPSHNHRAASSDHASASSSRAAIALCFPPDWMEADPAGSRVWLAAADASSSSLTNLCFRFRCFVCFSSSAAAICRRFLFYFGGVCSQREELEPDFLFLFWISGGVFFFTLREPDSISTVRFASRSVTTHLDDFTFNKDIYM